MKILLIQPYSRFFATYPPLGLMYLAAYIREKRKDNIKILDMRTKRMEAKKIFTIISSFKPDVVGISGMSCEFEGINEVARQIKAVSKDITVIVGGAHATTFPEMTLKEGSIDYAVIGEGELTLLELLDAIEKKIDIDKILGLAYRKDGNVVINPSRPLIDNLDELPFPAWDLLELESYFNNPVSHNVFQAKKRFMPLFTSRGCPYRCAYCKHILGYKYRTRSAENVLREIDILVKKYHIEDLQIEDDSFNIDLKRAKEIFKGIINKSYNLYISFPSGIRADCVDAEFAKLLRQGGTYRLSLGIETVSKRIKKMINKEIMLEKLTSAINLLTKEGINTNGFFMIGFPTETRQEMVDTINFAVNSKLTTAYFSKVTLFAGTPLYDMFKDKIDYGDPNEDDFSYRYTSNNLSEISDLELGRLYKLGFRRFYFSDGRFIKIYWASPNKIKYFKFYFNHIRRQLFTPDGKVDLVNISDIFKSFFKKDVC